MFALTFLSYRVGLYGEEKDVMYLVGFIKL